MPSFPLFDIPLCPILVDVRAVAEVMDCAVVVGPDGVAGEYRLRSELCHQIGIPSPNIVA